MAATKTHQLTENPTFFERVWLRGHATNETDIRYKQRSNPLILNTKQLPVANRTIGQSHRGWLERQPDQCGKTQGSTPWRRDKSVCMRLPLGLTAIDDQLPGSDLAVPALHAAVGGGLISKLTRSQRS